MKACILAAMALLVWGCKGRVPDPNTGGGQIGRVPPDLPRSQLTTSTASRPAHPLWNGKETVADYAKRAGIKDTEITLNLDGKVTMKLILTPAGRFMMGSPSGEKHQDDDEGPQHEVTISKPFYIGIYTVTQEQWKAVMGTTVAQQRTKANRDWPLGPEGYNHPMYYVSWNEATEFCRRLSRRTGRTVHLPTEGQWEYACRAGSGTRFQYGDDANYTRLGDYAWYGDNSGLKTHPVGQKKGNDWGLYDMHGNVWQWCSDWYGPYDDKKLTDPAGPATGTFRILRGGGWDCPPQDCRSAVRDGNVSDKRFDDVGFRVVLDLTPSAPEGSPARPGLP
ncbi:MAG TPA: formylglycine-generating enzyme family protein [Phycisphaerae bacterium]|nr:formylglycine-generating enzyme family protein [Phycisphaerae bacterium]